ncbi:MAG: hypothetical protein N2691_04220 [Patescibacteria group bacterium]|nr:hypothetical protein [Patescibacteria group bacterium]
MSEHDRYRGIEHGRNSEYTPRGEYFCVVSIVPIQEMPPEIVFDGYDLSVVRAEEIPLTRATFIQKDERARNPLAVSPIHCAIDESPRTLGELAAQELRDELQCPVVVSGLEKPMMHYYDVSLPDGTTLKRHITHLVVFGKRVLESVGANPVDKIKRVIRLTPFEVSKLFEKNGLGEDAPLLSSLQYSPGSEPLNPEVAADPVDIYNARWYYETAAYWAECRARVNLLAEMFGTDMRYAEELTGDDLMDFATMLEKLNQSYSTALQEAEKQNWESDFDSGFDIALFRNPQMILHWLKKYYDAFARAQDRINAEMQNNGGRQQSFTEAYAAVYASKYFREIITLKTHDAQKPYLDAAVLTSRGEPTVEMLETVYASNPMFRELIDGLHYALNLPSNPIDYGIAKLLSEYQQAQADPSRIKMVRSAFTNRVFGGEDTAKQHHKDAIELIEDIQNTFRPLYEDEGEFERDFKQDQSLHMHPVDQLGAVLGVAADPAMLAPDLRFQLLRHLFLMLHARELRPQYQEMLDLPATALTTLTEVLNELNGSVQINGMQVPLKSVSNNKTFLSFFRKVLERTKRIYDVHRTTIAADAPDPATGMEAISFVLNETVRRLVAQRKQVTIRNIKIHPHMSFIIDRLAMSFPGYITIDREHSGSEATQLEHVHWGKVVVFVRGGAPVGAPVEIGFAAREKDMEEKEVDQASYVLRRLLTVQSMTVVEALMADHRSLRDRILRYYYNRGVGSLRNIAPERFPRRRVNL